MLPGFAHSISAGPALRLGILVDGPKIFGQFTAVLRDLLAADFCSVVTVLRPLNAGRPRYPHTFYRGNSQAPLLYRAYSHIDARRWHSLALGYEPIDWQPFLRDTPMVDSKDPHTLNGLRLDIILNLGCSPAADVYCAAAKQGLWQFRLGNAACGEGMAPLIREPLQNCPVSSVAVDVRTPQRGWAEIARIDTPTAAGLSHLRNLVAPCASASSALLTSLRKLHCSGHDALVRCAPLSNTDQLATGPILPGNFAMARGLVREMWRTLKRRFMVGSQESQWCIALRPALPGLPWSHPAEGFRWVQSPANRIYTDPFLFEYAGRTWLFVEDFEFAKNRGVIGVCEVLDNGSLTPMTVALDKPYHLSFPNVFRVGAQTYMIPETASSGFVEIYRAVHFPYTWDRDYTLLDGAGRDTVFHADASGNCYFLTTLKDSQSAQGLLCIFQSDSVTGEWRLHPASPISSSARTARNGGALLSAEGKLYRVSQDSVPRYGSRLHFHEIKTFTPTDYQEQLVATIEPDAQRKHIGTHTYSRSSRWEATDALKLVSSFGGDWLRFPSG